MSTEYRQSRVHGITSLNFVNYILNFCSIHTLISSFICASFRYSWSLIPEPVGRVPTTPIDAPHTPRTQRPPPTDTPNPSGPLDPPPRPHTHIKHHGHYQYRRTFPYSPPPLTSRLPSIYLHLSLPDRPARRDSHLHTHPRHARPRLQQHPRHSHYSRRNEYPSLTHCPRVSHVRSRLLPQPIDSRVVLEHRAWREAYHQR